MEAAVEVALSASVGSARIMGSAEGFISSGVVMGEVRWHTEGACSAGCKKDNIHAVNVQAPTCWRKIPDSEVRVEVHHLSSLHGADAVNGHDSGNMNYHPPTIDLDAKPVLQKSGKIVRKRSGCTKRSGMVHMEVFKHKSGLHDVNEKFPEPATSYASCNVSEKNQLVKQKNSSTSRRGDKRNSKANCKSRCDSFLLRNGLVGFNSAAGGNNFIGTCGSKSDVFDFTKYVDEPSLDELLRGSYSYTSIKDKGKTTTNSTSNLLQSVRNACSILQAQKVLQAQNCAEADNTCIRKDSIGLISVSSAVGQTDGSKGDCGPADLPSSEKVRGSDDKVKMSDTADFPLYKPKDILEHLALSPPKDLDVLLSVFGASKTTSSPKNISDARLGKPVPQRTGLPPFSWSHSFSGHNKLGSDAVKLSTSRTICQGRWVKVKNCTALQKGSADLLKDFESLTFDQSLVPLISGRQENEFAPVERVFSASGAFSPSKFPTDEYSTTHAAAQTLLDMAAYSQKKLCAALKLMEKPSQMDIKASKSKATERSEFFFQASKSSIRSKNPLQFRDDGFSLKKPKLSTDVTNTYISHTEPMRKGTLDPSSFMSVKSPPPRKLFRDPEANTDSCGINLVKKPFVIKTQRATDKPSSSKPKFWKSAQ